MAKLRTARHGLATPAGAPKLRAVRHGLTGAVTTRPKLRAIRHGLAGAVVAVVNPLPSYTNVEPGTVITYTASLTSGTADSWTWRVISGATTVTGTGATVTVAAPADINGATAQIGVTATVSGVTSAEVVSTITALPQTEWWWDGTTWVPAYDTWGT
jgi:hypothetical protein